VTSLLLQTVDQRRVALETAAWLKKLRLLHGLSQAKAAGVAGVSRNTFSSWERGRTAPLLFQVKRLEAFEKQRARHKGASR